MTLLEAVLCGDTKLFCITLIDAFSGNDCVCHTTMHEENVLTSLHKTQPNTTNPWGFVAVQKINLKANICSSHRINEAGYFCFIGCVLCSHCVPACMVHCSIFFCSPPLSHMNPLTTMWSSRYVKVCESSETFEISSTWCKRCGQDTIFLFLQFSAITNLCTPMCFMQKTACLTCFAVPIT